MYSFRLVVHFLLPENYKTGTIQECLVHFFLFLCLTASNTCTYRFHLINLVRLKKLVHAWDSARTMAGGKFDNLLQQLMGG